MRIPGFLISLLQRITPTRAWKHRWKIAAFAPFLAAVLAVLAIIIFKYHVRSSTIAKAQQLYIQTKQNWTARGNSLDIEHYFPAPPPPEDDLFSHPAIVAELDKKNTPALQRLSFMGLAGIAKDIDACEYDTGKPCDPRTWLDPLQPSLDQKKSAAHCLTLLNPIKPRLDALKDASLRNAAYFPAPNLENSTLPLRYLHNTAELLSRRAILHIHAETPDMALDDIMAIQRLASHCQQCKCLLGLVVQAGLISDMSHAISHGLAHHCWSSTQLKTLADCLTKIDPTKTAIPALHGEVAIGLYFADNFITVLDDTPEPDTQFSLPKNYNLAGLKTSYQENKQACAPVAFAMVSNLEDLQGLIHTVLYPGGKACTTIPPSAMPAIFTPQKNIYLKTIRRLVFTFAEFKNLQAAVTLEHHRLTSGTYPKTLPSIPPDIYTGTPLSYKTNPDGSLTIWSVGQDFHDNGGDPDTDQTLTLPAPPLPTNKLTL